MAPRPKLPISPTWGRWPAGQRGCCPAGVSGNPRALFVFPTSPRSLSPSRSALDPPIVLPIFVAKERALHPFEGFVPTGLGGDFRQEHKRVYPPLLCGKREEDAPPSQKV